MFESSLSLTTRNRPVRPGTAPATDRPFNPQDVPRSELLEHTIARIEREFRGLSPALASGRSPRLQGRPSRIVLPTVKASVTRRTSDVAES